MARLRLLLAASCLAVSQSADVGRTVRRVVVAVGLDVAVRSRSPSRDPPLPREDRGSRSQGRDGLDPRGHQFHDASCRRSVDVHAIDVHAIDATLAPESLLDSPQVPPSLPKNTPKKPDTAESIKTT